MADGVHPLVDAMEPSGAQPTFDRPRAEAQGDELAMGDHSVLAVGERGDRGVARTFPLFLPYARGFVGRIGHGLTLADQLQHVGNER
jgi:hypothetical protein